MLKTQNAFVKTLLTICLLAALAPRLAPGVLGLALVVITLGCSLTVARRTLRALRFLNTFGN